MKKICAPLFIAALFAIAKIWKQPNCPSADECIKKMWHTHTHKHTHDYSSAIKKNEISPFATIWMDFEGIRLNEISHTKRRNK